MSVLTWTRCIDVQNISILRGKIDCLNVTKLNTGMSIDIIVGTVTSKQSGPPHIHDIW